ncbi:unnamed protein product [Rhizoctonia solani]|uniref:UBA domain-containing protein n=1 Tax=Rhizoctonia solani TaxID=456999 RepID=A0A8H2XGY6_9AGAM|nr:unnamed protein product [Rhizoctonia solani]
MSDFADLWNSVTPNASKQPANQSLGSQLNAANRNTLGASSQPNSRAHTPSYFLGSGISPQSVGQPQRSNPSLTVTGISVKSPASAKSPPSASAGDAFGDLFALSGTSQGKNMTIAERQAQASREQAKAQELAKKERETNVAFWDQLEFSSSGRSTPMSNANHSTASLAAQPQPQAPRINTQLLTPSRVSPLPSSKPSASAITLASNADIWDLDSFLTSSKPVSPAPAPSSVVSPGPRSAQTNRDLFEFLDSTPSTEQGNSDVAAKDTPERSATPGDFDWGDREDGDDLLGELSKPVAQARKNQPRPNTHPDRQEHTPRERQGSPPPHILGQIVEMGFSLQQAKRALANTSTGIDVQAALESLLAGGAPDSREDRGPSEEDLERFRAEDEAAREQYEIERQGRRARPNRNAPPEPTSDDTTRQLQERADQIMAQASIFGSSVLNRANALWKESKEKALKAYEERSAASTSSARPRDPARPAWMTEGPSPSDVRIPEHSGFRDDDSDLPARPRPKPTRPTPDRQTSQPTIVTTAPTRPADKLASLFSDTTAYVSPSRRKAPSNTSTPVQPSPTENRIKSPPIQLRIRSNPTVSADTLSAVQTHRTKGTDSFKLGQYGAAIESYTAALELLPEGHLTRVPLLNNRAAARSKIGDTSGAIEDCTVVLQVIGDDFDPTREAPVLNVDLNAAFVKALRRRAEMLENTEKWKQAREDWERLVKVGGIWAGGKASSDGVRGVGRCKRMEDGGGTPVSKPHASVTSIKPKARPRPVPARATPSNPEDSAVHRLKVANAAAEAEGDQKHALKDSIDASISAWKGGSSWSYAAPVSEFDLRETGKETNIRALIASLDTVLWPELGWAKVGMHELVMPNQVKIKYVKAIAKVHPDKLNTNSTTVEQRMIANSVFGALNEAWNAFEQ